MNLASKLHYEKHLNEKIEMLFIQKLIYDESANGRSRYKYICKCDCGTVKTIPCWYILVKHLKSCGCLQYATKINHNANVGKRFGSLLILAVKRLKLNNDVQRKLYYECECNCGNIRFYQAHLVIKGDFKSCGCKQMAETLDRMKSHIGKKFGRLTITNTSHYPDEKYTYNRHTFTCKCDCGNVIELPVSRLLYSKDIKSTCGQCFKNNKSYTGYSELLEYCKSINIKLVSEYTTKSYPKVNKETGLTSTVYNKYQFLCLKCNRKFVKTLAPSSLLVCPYCRDRFASNSEELIAKFLSALSISHQSDMILSDDNYQTRVEIDFNIPSHNIGIELHGLKVHATYGDSTYVPWYVKSKYPKYHLNKLNSAKNNNIDLLQFWNSEVLQKLDIVKSIIRNRLKMTKYSEYARNCYVNVIDSYISDQFISKHHIQGTVHGDSVRLGLFYKKTNNLISVMTFGKSRYSVHEYEMFRFASYINCRIVGGASKLFKFFIRNYNPKSIITYSDRRLFDNGKLYSVLGFKFDHISPPNYWYFKKHMYETSVKLFHRTTFQKHKLSKLLRTFDSDKTEVENMEENNYLRVYDCGNKVYLWRK